MTGDPRRPLVAAVDRAPSAVTPDGRSTVFLEERWAAALSVATGTLISIGAGPRTGLAIVEVTPDLGQGAAVVRMDGLLRQSLHAQMGAEVRLAPALGVPVARTVRLRPPVHLAEDGHDFASSIRDALANVCAPVFPEARLWLRLHTNGTAAMVFVVEDVDGGWDEGALVGDTTEVVLVDPPEDFNRAQEVGLDSVGGLDDIVDELVSVLSYGLEHSGLLRWLEIPPPRGVILHGPPGTGKTHLTRALARELGAHFSLISAPDIVATGYGETEQRLRKLFGEAAHHAPSIICIDELDAIAGVRSGLGNQADLRAVSQLLALMDGLQRVDGVVVVGTTNRLEALDPAFRRAGRFDREVFVGPPTVAGRREIIEIYSRNLPLDDAAQASLDAVAAGTNGFVGADLMELMREAAFSAVRRSAPSGNGQFRSLVISPADLEEARARVRPSGARYALVHQPLAGAMARVPPDSLAAVLALGKAAIGSDRAAALIGGCLLTGPSGSGKTSLAHAAAGSLDVPVVVVNGGAIYSRWLGDSEAAVRDVFARARRIAPSVLLLDSLDALAPSSDVGLDNAAIARVVAQIGEELDQQIGRDRVLVVGTASNRQSVDPSLLRPGRLGMVLPVRLPDGPARSAIALDAARELGIDLDQAALEWIVDSCDGMAGGAIRGLVGLACMLAPAREVLGPDELRRAQSMVGSETTESDC